MHFQIRKATQADRQAIPDVVIAAFGDTQGNEIADLVDELLVDPTAKPILSLVAESKNVVVGHILFTNVRITHAPRSTHAAILAPLSVHPDYQDQGIGGQLIHEGLHQLRAAGVELVFVLGHPDYYPKHGFAAAGVHEFDAPYPIPPENADAWMVQELRPNTIGRVKGTVLCADALNHPKHWRE